ncbi:MAG: hypothetical protein QNJ16_05590 [Rhodobacter sp.]|nr:hypothetical protein [Rhodobacter sp.]
MSDTSRMKAVLVAVGAVAFAASPFMSGAFGGFRPDQFPVPQIDPPVQPAGYAFSIWGLIYLGLVAHGVFGLVARADDAGWDRGRWPLVISLAVGAAWIPVAQVSAVWAAVLIWVMLVTALMALAVAPRGAPWLGRVPLGLYAGWLTAAAWVSVALVAAGYGIGPGAVGWAWIALAAALVMAAAVLRLLGPALDYAAPIAWALVAITVQNWPEAPALATAAASGAAVLLIYTMVILPRVKH